MRFDPRITSHDDGRVTIDINFEDKKKMSVGGQGEIVLHIREPTIFKSAENLDSVTEDSFENRQTKYEFTLPPIIDDPEAAARLAKQTEEAGDFMQSMSGGNMAVSLIL